MMILSSGLYISTRAQKTKGFTLNCQIKGMPNGTKVYLRKLDNGDTIARAISKNDVFTFKGELALDGSFHYISKDTLISKVPLGVIFLENKPMSVHGILGERNSNVVTGSPSHNDFVQFIKVVEDSLKTRNKILRDALQQNLLAQQQTKDPTILEELKKKHEEMRTKQEEAGHESNQFVLKWISNHTSSLYAPKVIMQAIRKKKEKEEAYNRLTSEAKHSYYGVALRNELEKEKLESSLQKDAIIPNFSITGSDGTQIKILDVAAKSKFMLIDVWASWCKPCRAEIPALKQLYETHKSKGLNILGISSDKNESAWRKAIIEDGTTWLHGLQKDGTVSKTFNIKAIPAYILIDAKGKLIAFDCAMSSIPNFGGGLRGESLEKKLEELLGK